MCNIIYLHSLAMEKAKSSGHDVTTCIVVRHLPRLYRSMNATNGTNGSSSDIIDLHSDVYFFIFIKWNMIFLQKLNMGHVFWQVPWTDGRDYWWHDEMDDVEPSCYPVWVSAEDPLFMLYTRLVSLSTSIQHVFWYIIN